ncbi:unnamed protein product [Echinostoma caproni]|uniref:G_PROTEIN_RECEP_F1_2 domain-containing protein n=1 Tax=Echinostoma caproni TaxID=27848 RepID=A0A183A904_9TREM|nr:unnamed protein product [Echinostoma caproni]
MLVASDAYFLAIDVTGGILLVCGFLFNLLGFLLFRQVNIRSVASRYLLAAQYMFDAAGCIVIFLYLITYNLDIVRARFVYTWFCSIWLSHYLFWLANGLSATNMVLLSLDRYWAVVWAISYPKKPKHYVPVLVGATWIFSIVFTIPLLRNNMCFPTVLNGTIQPFETDPNLNVIGFVFGYAIPSLVLCVLQFRTLFAIRRLKRSCNLTRPDQDNASLDPNLLVISVATTILTTVYSVSRGYTQLIALIRSFGVHIHVFEGDWERPYYIVYGLNFLVEPLALTLSMPSVRMLISKQWRAVFKSKQNSNAN